MSTWTDIEDTIRNWVLTASGAAEERVIFAKQNVKRPAGNQLFYRIDTNLFNVQVGRVPYQALNVDEKLEIYNLERFMVTVSAFGITDMVTAYEALCGVVRKLNLPSIRQSFKSINLGLLSKEPVIDTSYDENRETRHQAFCELMFNAYFIDIDDPGVFDTVVVKSHDIRIGDLTITSNI